MHKTGSFEKFIRPYRLCLLIGLVVVSVCQPLHSQAAGWRDNCQALLTGLAPAKQRLDKWLHQYSEPWLFSPTQEQQFQAIAHDQSLSPEERLYNLYQALVTARLANRNKLAARFADSAARDALHQRSWYARTVGGFLAKYLGPHYNPLINRVAMLLDQHPTHFSLQTIVAIHEVEHAIQRNSTPLKALLAAYVIVKERLMVVRPPFSPLIQRHLEVGAMAAQWELASRLSQADRDYFLQVIQHGSAGSSTNQAWQDEVLQRVPVELENPSRLFRNLRPIYIATLRHASLSKREFVDALSPEHGYELRNLMGEHYKPSVWKAWLLGLGGLSSAVITLQGGNPDLVSKLQWDFWIMMKLLGY